MVAHLTRVNIVEALAWYGWCETYTSSTAIIIDTAGIAINLDTAGIERQCSE